MNSAAHSLTVILPRRKAPSTAAIALLGATLLTTGFQSAAAQATAAPAKASGKEYALTKTSSFDAPAANSRNPFWPIGWVPGPAVATQTAAIVYDVKPEDFSLSTTSLDYPPLAIINGRSYAVGDVVPVATAGQETVKVKQIQDGVVLLDHRGRELRIVAGKAASRAAQK